MSSAIAAYLVAAVLMVEYNLSPEEAAERADILWREITKRVR